VYLDYPKLRDIQHSCVASDFCDLSLSIGLLEKCFLDSFWGFSGDFKKIKNLIRFMGVFFIHSIF
jgi:hypothetical protein